MKARVVAVVFEGYLLLDLAGPLGVLEVAGHYVDGYAVELVSVSGGAVRSSDGISVEAGSFAAGSVDLLIVPGGPGTGAAMKDRALLALIRSVSGCARRSVSVCSGALLLAAAGLLDGKRATTHWGATATLRELYPQIAVDGESIFIEDGNIWTSAGITTGIDLALALVEKDHGFAIAQQVARGLVVYHRRPGGQRQISAALALQEPDGRFGPLMEWARERLHECLGVDRLAAQCGLSPRQFSRAFTRAMGMPPAKAIEKLRLDKARSDVLAGQESLEIIARRHGFGAASRMRRAFMRMNGDAPKELRRKR